MLPDGGPLGIKRGLEDPWTPQPESGLGGKVDRKLHVYINTSGMEEVIFSISQNCPALQHHYLRGNYHAFKYLP